MRVVSLAVRLRSCSYFAQTPSLVMSRIRKAYETRFRALLQELNSRRLDQGVRWWSNHAQQLPGGNPDCLNYDESAVVSRRQIVREVFSYASDIDYSVV